MAVMLGGAPHFTHDTVGHQMQMRVAWPRARDDDEFVPADAGNEIGLAAIGTQHLAGMDQHGVARCMA